MPRYFFHVPNASPDAEGTELRDIHAAREAAVCLGGEMLRELDGKFWDAPIWQLQVADHEQRVLFTLTFSAQDAAP